MKLQIEQFNTPQLVSNRGRRGCMFLHNSVVQIHTYGVVKPSSPVHPLFPRLTDKELQEILDWCAAQFGPRWDNRWGYHLIAMYSGSEELHEFYLTQADDLLLFKLTWS